MKKQSLALRLVMLLLALAIVQAPGLQAADEEEKQGVLLETIGAFSAQSMLLTYTSIGSAADAYVKEAYTKEEAVNLIQTCMSLSQTAKEQLQAVLDAEALSDEGDIAFVKQAKLAFAALEAQATAFIKFTETGAEADSNAFEQQRQKAWGMISTLLGIEE